MIRTLLLAAGSSRRFGSNKLLAPLADGTPVVLRAAQVLSAAGCRVLVVVRPDDRAVADRLASLRDLEASPCPTAERGVGNSLAWAVAHSADAAGWLVALGDMPFLREASVRAVLRAARAGASIAAPVYNGRRGHPVFFSRHWRERLLALTGDRGGQVILHASPDALTPVPCDDPGVLRDIDAPADLRV